MKNSFNIHDWQAKQRLLTEERSSESMSNADIRALQTVVSDYSLNKILNTLAIITDKTGKHDEADMIQNLANQISPSSDFNKWVNDEYLEERDAFDTGMDARLAQQMGMSDDEFEKNVTSRDIGSPFPGTDNVSPFTAKAKDYTEKFKQEYREMSDDGIDEFNKEIIEYLLNAFPSAQATAKVFFAKKGI